MPTLPKTSFPLLLYMISFLILPAYRSWPATSQDKVPSGVVVEALEKGNAAESGGIQVGDVISSWSRAASPPANPQAASGPIESPFDFSEVETEQAPRGMLIISGRRGSAELSWAIRFGHWGLTVRPLLPEHFHEVYLEGQRQMEAKNVAEGSTIWRNGGIEAKKSGETVLAEWFLFKSAQALSEAHIWPKADEAYSEAVGEAQQQKDPTAASQLLSEWARTFMVRNDWKQAEDCLRQALERQQVAPESLASAQTMNRLGTVAASQRDLSKAEDFFQRALAIRRKWAPESLEVAASLDSLGNIVSDRGDLAMADDLYHQALAIETKLVPAGREVAGTLNSLGVLAWNRGDLGASEDFYQQALTIWEKQAPNTINMAKTLMNLGNVAYSRGDLAGAEKYFQRSLAIQEALSPGSLLFATILNNLGVVAWNRGDLAGADDLYGRALAIRQKLAPNSIDVAASFNNLGLLAWNRADLMAAEGYFRQALAIYEKQAPASVQVAIFLTNLGNVAHDRGDLQAAGEYGQRALAIYEKRAPDSLDVARSLGNLGNVARDREDLNAAEDYDRRALVFKEKLAPSSLTVALSLNSLGELADKRNDFASAEQYFLKSLAIRERLAPGTLYEAESLHSLGTIYRHSGKPEKATDFLCHAVDALEKQKTKIGGTAEEKSSFGAKFADYYRACIESLVDVGRQEEALYVLERSRARSLLAMLAERDLLFAADLPQDIARQRRLADADYDKTQASLNKLSADKDAPEIERLTQHLREVRERQQAIVDQIRKSSPHFASLQYPQPLDLAGVRDVLDPGTVLLSYSTGQDKSFLFVVHPASVSVGGSGLSVLVLPIGEQALREKVQTFRNVIERRKTSDQQVLKQQASELYDLLIKPAAALIANDERLLICPDGPLHTLPFAALMRGEKGGKTGETRRYLIEWKPIHTIISATVYGELKKSRHNAASAREFRVTAFGDPKYPAYTDEKPEQVADAELRSAVMRGMSLAPLPSTRIEVENIARLFPTSTGKYLGEQATEERAKSTGKEVRYIHFAVHGLLDERFPLNSALALAIPENPSEGQDNGLLQAWEIFEQVHIDADLVTLSACETALGKEMGGEGLVGLTRAFQYAGARSVLASLWSVSDESTAKLMTRLYEYLKAGKPKDEALRSAQMDLINSLGAHRTAASEFSHPFHWAAFQLTGDWK